MNAQAGEMCMLFMYASHWCYCSTCQKQQRVDPSDVPCNRRLAVDADSLAGSLCWCWISQSGLTARNPSVTSENPSYRLNTPVCVWATAECFIDQMFSLAASVSGSFIRLFSDGWPLWRMMGNHSLLPGRFMPPVHSDLPSLERISRYTTAAKLLFTKRLLVLCKIW